MLNIAVILFAISALGGITLATLHLRHKPLPLALALGHGLLAAAALVLLIIIVVGGVPAKLLLVSLVLFIIAALGGFALFSFHLRRQPLPTPVVFIHGLVAVAAFLILLVTILR